MASKTILVLHYREPPPDSDYAQLLPNGEEYSDKDRARRRAVGSAVEAAGRGEADQGLRKRVAIVDDDPDLLTTYSFVLEHLGYLTLTASDGDEIVDQVLNGDEAPPDLVLMDYRLPKTNGLEAAKTILRNRPGIKIIISTADDSIKQEAISIGMKFLQKPFSVEELASAIREDLGGEASAANP